MYYLKSFGINKKKLRFFVFQLFKTETRINSEKITQTYNYIADVVTFFGKIFYSKVNSKKFFV